MIWRHGVTTSYEWKTINIFEINDLQNHGNKKIINFLAHLQAEIGESSLVNAMTWRRDVTVSQK